MRNTILPAAEVVSIHSVRLTRSAPALLSRSAMLMASLVDRASRESEYINQSTLSLAHFRQGGLKSWAVVRSLARQAGVNMDLHEIVAVGKCPSSDTLLLCV